MDISILSEISDIWNTFFFPIFDSICVFLLLYFIVGKQDLIAFVNSHYYKRSNTVFRAKKILQDTSGKRNTADSKYIYVPVNPTLISILSRPAISVSLLLILIYVLYNFIDTIYNICRPVSYSYWGEATVLNAVPKDMLAKIWAYFPEFDFTTLCMKFFSDISYSESAFSHNVDMTANFCIILCIILTFVFLVQRRWAYLSRLSVCAVCLSVSLCFWQFSRFENLRYEFLNNAYDAIIIMETERGSWDVESHYKEALEKIEFEKAPPYIGSKIGFILYFFGTSLEF